MHTAVNSEETSVYPGHPVCIAVRIMELYPSLAAALQRNEQEHPTPAALINTQVRGAGGNVHAALDLLSYWLKGHVEHALPAAHRYWTMSAGPFGDAVVAQGEAQAQAALPRFQALVVDWALG